MPSSPKIPEEEMMQLINRAANAFRMQEGAKPLTVAEGFFSQYENILKRGIK